jgi:DNA-binding response OmpR family regulator
VTDGETCTVLCVDPETPALEDVVGAFDGQPGFEPVTARGVESGTDVAETDGVDCVVAEYALPDGTGFELFDRVREHHPNAACVLFTDAGHAEIDSTAFRDTIAEYLPKGGRNSLDRLVEVTRNAVVNRTQVGFPLPAAEDERLEAVGEYDVEDLRAVDAFDRISELVATHFDIGVAFVGLLDEEQERFLACHGADWKTLAREDSVCTHAIVEDGTTVIEDVQADPRFEHNETLRQLGVCSYAGVDIDTPDGYTVGELCCIDDEPRSYTDEELADLRLFAEEVAEQLELRLGTELAEGTGSGLGVAGHKAEGGGDGTGEGER